MFDFDGNKNLVSVEIFDATKVLSKLLAKIINLTNLKEMKADIINFRNMATIRIKITTDSASETVNITIPRITEESPALGC